MAGMNEKTNEFINGIGSLVETWRITFEMFIQSGMNEKKALAHTREFMTAMMSSSMFGNNQKGNENDQD